MPKFVRARAGTGVLRHPESGALTAPDPAVPLEASDPLVKAFPWAFVSDEDLAAEMQTDRLAWRESTIEAARRADVLNAEREKAAKEQDADAERDIRTGETVDDEVEEATARPGQKSNARRKK